MSIHFYSFTVKLASVALCAELQFSFQLPFYEKLCFNQSLNFFSYFLFRFKALEKRKKTIDSKNKEPKQPDRYMNKFLAEFATNKDTKRNENNRFINEAYFYIRNGFDRYTRVNFTIKIFTEKLSF